MVFYWPQVRVTIIFMLLYRDLKICISLFLQDDKWRRNRRLLTPAFHFQILENFFDVFDSNANIFCQQLQKVVGTGQEIDVYPYLKRCTLDVICGWHLFIQNLEIQFHIVFHVSFHSINYRNCNGDSSERTTGGF